MPLLGCAAWVAFFLHSGSFGLYEDDYAFISPALGWHLSDLPRVPRYFGSWPQERPLGFALPPVLTFLGARLGDLHAVYVIAFLVLTLNSFLFYFLLRRVGSEPFALCGALAFCLFPADTTRPFLMHATGLQPSLTFLLIACLCYLAGRRFLSYVVALGSLLTYESPFMVFLAVPLLKDKWDRGLGREFLRHAAVLAAMLAAVFAIRTYAGDDRVALSTGSLFVPAKAMAGMVIGPLATIALFFYGPLTSLTRWGVEAAIVFSVSTAILSLALGRSPVTPHAAGPHLPRPRPISVTRLAAAIGASRPTRVLLAALVMLCLGYAFSFTHFPPVARFGRATSVHLAAVVGASLLVAWSCEALLRVATGYGLRSHVGLLVAVFFSLLASYGLSIQQDFARSWQNQRAFWTDVVRVCPDLTEGTVILVQHDGLPETRLILTHSWADPMIPAQLYRFPSSWTQPPQLFVVDDDWTQDVVTEGTQYRWVDPATGWPVHLQNPAASNMIFLHMAGGTSIRYDDPVTIDGMVFHPRSTPPLAAQPTWPRGPLFSLMIDEARLNAAAATLPPSPRAQAGGTGPTGFAPLRAR